MNTYQLGNQLSQVGLKEIQKKNFCKKLESVGSMGWVFHTYQLGNQLSQVELQGIQQREKLLQKARVCGQ